MWGALLGGGGGGFSNSSTQNWDNKATGTFGDVNFGIGAGSKQTLILGGVAVLIIAIIFLRKR